MEWLTRNGYVDYSRKKNSATDDQVAEYERLVDELKAEIAKIPEPDHEPTVPDMRDNEPYQRLTDEHLDKIVSMLEGWDEFDYQQVQHCPKSQMNGRQFDDIE